MRSIALLLLKVAGAVGALALLFHFVEFEKVLITIKTANTGVVGFGVLVFLIGQVVAAERWRLILRGGAVEITLGAAWRMNQIGTFAGNFLPGMATGDLAKSALLFSAFPDRRSFLVSSVTYDRIVGFLAILIIATIGAVILGISIGNWSFVLPVVIIAGLFLLGIKIIDSRFFWNWIPRSIAMKGSAFVEELRQLLRNKTLIWPTLGLSLGFQVSWVVSMWIMLCSIQNDAALLPVVIAAPLSLLVAMLPVSINGLGLREGAFSYILENLGVDPQIAVAASILGLLPLLASSLIGGILLVFRRI